MAGTEAATPLMPVGRSVQRSNHPPGPSSVRQAVVLLVRWRRSAADDHWRTMNIHRLDGTLWLAASCKLQYHANDVCKTASLAGFLLSFVVVAVWV